MVLQFFFNYAVVWDAYGTYKKSDLWLYVSSNTNYLSSKLVMFLVASFTQTFLENLIGNSIWIVENYLILKRKYRKSYASLSIYISLSVLLD